MYQCTYVEQPAFCGGRENSKRGNWRKNININQSPKQINKTLSLIWEHRQSNIIIIEGKLEVAQTENDNHRSRKTHPFPGKTIKWWRVATTVLGLWLLATQSCLSIANGDDGTSAFVLILIILDEKSLNRNISWGLHLQVDQLINRPVNQAVFFAFWHNWHQVKPALARPIKKIYK